MIYEANDLSKLDRALRSAYAALDMHDCEGAWKALRECLGRFHYARGALVVSHIAAGHSAASAARAADDRLRDYARALKLATTAFGEVCLDQRLAVNMKVPHALQGLAALGGLGAQSDVHPNAIAKILAALEKCRDALDEPDCVEAFMRLRDVRSAIMSLIGGMQTLKSIGMVPREGGDKTFNPIVARLEAMESEFINECVKGTKMGRGGSRTINGCCGLGSTPPDDWTEKKLSDLLPPLAIKQIERAHAKGTLTVNMLKDICHAHAPRLDAQGVDPTFLAYLLAQKLGVRL